MRKSRSIFYWILLSALLVFAQQGAAMHEISHYSDSLETSEKNNNFSLEGKLCLKCLGFSQADGTAHIHPPLFVIPTLSFDYSLIAPIGALAKDSPAYASRDPPISL